MGINLLYPSETGSNIFVWSIFLENFMVNIVATRAPALEDTKVVTDGHEICVKASVA